MKEQCLLLITGTAHTTHHFICVLVFFYPLSRPIVVHHSHELENFKVACDCLI